mmetsp:Transcript_8953/g.29640  ORF Transcript_8953/g.29640 Transcript_8953/m.29640 type:complete len:138 (+) Transcript_8953:1285-1698(+)
MSRPRGSNSRGGGSRHGSDPVISRRPIAARESCGLTEENLLLLLRDGCDEPVDSEVARRFPRRDREGLLSLLLSLRDLRRFFHPELRFLRRERLGLRLRLVLPRLSSLSLSLLLLLLRLFRLRLLAGRRRSESRWSE